MIILYVLLCIALLAVLITVHEFGHFIVAKKIGCQVNEFAIGMGPKLWSKQYGETKYSLRAIPIGGFCDIEGEAQVTYKEGSPRLICNKPAWQQLAVFLAGVTMNFIFGFVFIFLGYCIKATYSGWGLADIWASTVNLYGVSITAVFTALYQLFTGTLSGSDVGGVVGAVNQISSAAAASNDSIALIFALMGSISVNLALMNLLPLPCLDGGRCLLIILNKAKLWITKKPLSEKFQEKSIQATMVLILALTMVLLVKDVFDII